MENPFEIILARLDTIENKLDELRKEKNIETNNELMTVEEVATYINFQKTSVYGLIKKRQIPFIKASGKLHFRKSDIDKWLDSKKVKTKSDIEIMGNEYILKNSI